MMDERCYLVLDDGQAVIIDPDSVDDAAEAELAQRRGLCSYCSRTVISITSAQ